MGRRSIFAKKMAIILVMALIFNTISSYAAIVSDNDGSSFVTKAEFEAMKNNFAQQITDYENSITSKIDGAIASYLAGVAVSKDIDQDSLINKKEFKFVNNKEFQSSQKGDYFDYYVSWCYLSAQFSDRGTVPKGSLCSNQQEGFVYEFEGACDTWFVPKTKSSGTNKDRLYRISTVSIADKEYNKITKLYETTYTGIMAGSGMGGRGASPSTDTTTPTTLAGWSLFTPEIKTFEKKNDVEYFGQQTNDITIIKDGGTGTNWSNGAESVITAWTFDDTDMGDSTIDYLAGNEMSDTTAYCLLDVDVCKISDDVVGTFTPNMGASRVIEHKKEWQKSTGRISVPTAAEPALTMTMSCKLYRHKITELNPLNVINEDLSNIINKPVGYYRGVPLFTASTRGTATVELQFDNDAGANTTFELRNDWFDNKDVVATCSDIQSCTLKTADYTVASGEKVKFKFEVEKDKTYWIKALPVSGATTIKSKKIKVIDDL